MNMLTNMLGGLIDKEQIIYDTIQATLENVAEEYGLTYKDVFITIRPTDEEFNFKLYVCSYDEKGNPKALRQISLKEVLEN